MSRRLRLLFVTVALVAATTFVIGTSPSSADQNEGTTPALVDAQRLIAVGGLHTCAVMNTGVVRCWGDNANGQLGNGTRAVSTEPKPVSGIANAVAVTAGNTHTCALLNNATVKCWGLNSNGQIGADPVVVNSSTTPTAVSGLTDVRAIAAGGFHNCALLDTGRIRCWGLDGVGQLGDGDGTPSGDTFAPVEVAGITNAVAVAAGEFHTCALVATGGVKCWGHNGFGQVGDGTKTDTTTAVDVTGLPDGDKKVQAVTAGYGHTCAVLDDDDADVDENTIRCWGNNTQGQLGDGTTTDRTTPVTVKFDKDPNPSDNVYVFIDYKGADAVTGGQQHTCARTVSGSAWCWGNAGRGQIGNGTKGDTNIFLPDEGPGSERRFMWRSAKPASIDPTVSAVTAGGFHTCALRGASMQCWGYNFYGQLGSYLPSSAVPVTVTAMQGAESVATGTDSACARVQVPGTPDTHQPVCWGTNAHGELGTGLAPSPTSNSTVPVKVSGLADVSALTAGNGHACTLPTGSSSPLCWGDNDEGQLGNGSTVDANAPVAVSGLTTATQLSAHGRVLSGDEVGHTCARLQDGTAQCWGDNLNGQLGNNAASTSPSDVPVTVQYDTDPEPPEAGDDHFDPGPLTGVVEVAAGGTHSCALRNDGTNTTVWCWGRNLNGQIGDNTTTERRLATQVKLEDKPPDEEPDIFLTGVKGITAGERHSCALMAGAEDGKVRCWGANNVGQLGDGTNFERRLPRLIPSIPQGGFGNAYNPLAVALTAGTSHTCAVMANASARCWGDNSSGQLGSGGGSSANPVTPAGIDNETADTIRTKLSGSGQPDDLVTSLSAGRRNTCASLIDKTVSCWGSNISGQLGDGVGPTRTTPIGVLHLDEGVNGNKSPSALDDAAITAEDTPVATNVLANDADPDGDTVTVLQAKDPANGTAVGSGSTVTYTPDLNYCGSDVVSYRIFDGKNGVSDALLNVTVTCAQDPPVATDDAASTSEDAPVTVAVLANDTDPDGDALSVSSATQPLHGSTLVIGDAVKYSPAVDYAGPDSFTYVVSDGNGGFDTGSVALTVGTVNDPPVAADDAASTSEDTPTTVPVLANDTDPDGDALSVSSVTQPAHGSAVVVPGGVKYTPAADYSGPDSFTYSASDGNGGSASATVSLTVSPAGDSPVATDDAASTKQNLVVTVPVLANDTDPDGDVLSISSVTQPQHGSTVVVGDGVEYTPAADYSGPDSFTYVVGDGNGGSDSATVSLTVAPGNYPPFGGDDEATTNEDTAVTVPVLSNDFDPDGHPLTVVSVTQPAHGSASVVAGGVEYTPAQDYWGTDSFTYVVDDGNGGSDTVAVSMTVAPVNDPPVASDDASSTSEDAAVTVPVLANDLDADGDLLSVQSVTQPLHGSAVVVSGGVKYTPAPNYFGPDSFTYVASDGHGASDEATVSMSVASVNDVPTLDPVSDRTTTWGSLLAVQASGQDTDNDALTYSLLSAPAAAAVDADGMITWTPSAGDVGVHTITVRVSDGPSSADRSFRVTVTKQSTAIAYNGATSGQYSDGVALLARLTASGGAAVEGAAVAFTVAGKSAGASTDAAGDAVALAVLTAAPGPSNAVASFAGSAAYEPTSVSVPFAVTREDATVAITGPGLVTTTVGTAAATLSASVQEAGDGSLGTALGGAQVQFSDLSGTTLCTATVSSSSAGAGAASCTTGALVVASRGVVAKLLSSSYTAEVDVAALAVAAVPSGSAAGGGSVAPGGEQRSDFAFRATPGKRGAAPAGDAVQVFRRVADIGSGSRSYAFVVSTSSLTSLTRTCTGKSVKVCSARVDGAGATTAAVDLETGAVTALGGAATIRIDATDNAEPAGSVPPDSYAVAVVGPWPFSVGTASDQALLTGGNVRIPS